MANKEKKFRTIIQFASFGLVLLSLALAVYINDTSVFLAALIFVLALLMGVEAYLGIQHNVDRFVNVRETLLEGFVCDQKKFFKEIEENKKIGEEILDLLEILIDYLEEMKTDRERSEEILNALKIASDKLKQQDNNE